MNAKESTRTTWQETIRCYRAPAALQSEITPNQALAARVTAAVAVADWGAPGFEGRIGRIQSPRGEALLGVLTFCYALGIYSSEEIERILWSSSEASRQLRDLPIATRDLRKFRKMNRELLHRCLSQVLSSTVEAERRIQLAAQFDMVD